MDEGPRRFSVEELGGPPPLPLIGGRFAGDMRAGLAEEGIDFSREDGSTPGATQKSPFAPSKSRAGVFLSAPVLAEIAPRLLDLLEDQYRRDGVQMPDPVRKELSEAAEVGMQRRDFQRVYANTSEHFVDPECSSPT